MRIRSIVFVALSLMMRWPAIATSIAVQLDDGRILVAADTHAEHDQPNSRSEDNLNCKIEPLGKFAFAHTGMVDYIPSSLQDNLPAWKSQSDAEAAASTHPNNLVAIADDWADHAESHYTSFYFAAPLRLQDMIGTNPNRILVMGLFIGFIDGTPTVVAETVYLNSLNLEPVQVSKENLGVREMPYATNPVTDELLIGESERAKTAQDDWAKLSKGIVPKDRDFRKLEFYIQRTADFDSTVGKNVDVLELTPDKPPTWIQNPTCPKQAQK